MRWSDCYDVEPGGPEGAQTVVMHLHVRPSAGRTAVVGRHGHAVNVRVAAPPLDDRANDAVAALLAELVGVKVSAVALVSGARSRAKRFRIRGVDVETLDTLLDAAVDRETGTRAHRSARDHRS